jgi:hypothetical protein
MDIDLDLTVLGLKRFNHCLQLGNLIGLKFTRHLDSCWSSLGWPLDLVERHLLDQVVCITDPLVHKILTCCGINYHSGVVGQTIIESMQEASFLKTVVRAHLQQLLITISSLAKRFLIFLSEVSYLVPKRHSLRRGEILRKKYR